MITCITVSSGSNFQVAHAQKIAQINSRGLLCVMGRVLGGHYSCDWSEYVNVIEVISEPFAREFR